MPSAQPCVLVVEDNFLIAMEMERLVEACGFAVCGPAGSVSRALEVARDVELAGAVLDINLGAERSWPVAEALEQRGVPFLIATGYQAAEIPERYRGVPLLTKPIALEALRAALQKAGILDR